MVKALWHPGFKLAVDEAMSQFIKRAKETIIIAEKSIPIGFKIWIIAEGGYFLHWFLYTNFKGPQGIGYISKELGANKIVVIVIILLKALPQAHSLFIIIIDNLFIF